MPAVYAVVIRGLINEVAAILKGDVNTVRVLMVWLILAMGTTLTEAMGSFANVYCMQRLTDELNVRLTRDILTHAAMLDVTFFEDPRLQDVMERAQQGTALRFARFVTNMLKAMTGFLQVISLSAVLIVIEPIVTFLVLPLVVPYWVFHWRLAKSHYGTEYSRATKRRWTQYFVHRLTSHDSVPEVKLLDLAPLFVRKYSALMTEFRDQDRKLYFRGLVGNLVFAFVSVVVFYATFLRVATRVVQGSLTIGDVAIYGGAMVRLRYSLENAVGLVTNALQQTLHISNLRLFLSLRPQRPVVHTPETVSGCGKVEICDLTFTYPGSAEPALSSVSLQIADGETLALVGENGAGKTTLVKLIASLYEPDEGSVMFNGVDACKLDRGYLHSQISFVFQPFGRYEATAAENIAYGEWRSAIDDDERIRHVGRISGAHDTIQGMPQGYNTWLGRKFGEYEPSGGEWQKIAIARALARDGSLLILDEATSNLDARAEYELFCRFQEIAKGRTTILISHRFSTVSMADRIVVMDNGRIVEEGTHDELIAKAGHYAALYSLHQRQMGSTTERGKTGEE
jgi:ATP-binding cassette subfamily B protein